MEPLAPRWKCGDRSAWVFQVTTDKIASHNSTNAPANQGSRGADEHEHGGYRPAPPTGRHEYRVRTTWTPGRSGRSCCGRGPTRRPDRTTEDERPIARSRPCDRPTCLRRGRPDRWSRTGRSNDRIPSSRTFGLGAPAPRCGSNGDGTRPSWSVPRRCPCTPACRTELATVQSRSRAHLTNTFGDTSIGGNPNLFMIAKSLLKGSSTPLPRNFSAYRLGYMSSTASAGARARR